VESRSSRKRRQSPALSPDVTISRNTIKPPSEDKRPASKVAVSDLAATGDRPGRNGIAGMAMSAGSGGDAHASASGRFLRQPSGFVTAHQLTLRRLLTDRGLAMSYSFARWLVREALSRARRKCRDSVKMAQ
jgi:hypothetical protein